MSVDTVRTVISLLASLLLANACKFSHDQVLAGDYGPDVAGTGASASSPPGSRQGVTSTAGSPSAGTSSTPTGAAGKASQPTAGSDSKPPSAGTSAPSSAAGTSAPSTIAGSAAAGSGGMTGEMQPPAAGDTAPFDAGMNPPEQGPCSLDGRWLVTVHYVTDAIGQLQYCHSYLYYEIEQTADSFMVKKGLQCGDDAVGGGDFAATVDFSKSWNAAAAHVVHAGRKGSSAAASGGGCKVDLEKWYTVRGASLPYYLDPSKPLPSVENKAMGDTPGWEDWDMDGNPGLTGTISGVVSGKIFVAPRQWTQMSGSVSDVSSAFKLPVTWDQEQNVMAYDGSPLLSSGAVRAADATLHFAQLARLAPDQATGDDAAICGSITQLAKTLTPEAAGM